MLIRLQVTRGIMSVHNNVITPSLYFNQLIAHHSH